MLFSQSLPTLFALFAGLQQVVDATPRYCPPYGPVLPAPRHASQHPAVQYAVGTITTVLKGQTGGFNLSGVSVGVKSIYEDEPLLDFHYTPPTKNPKEGVRKIDASTVYRLGSITKVFTVLAALRLAEDGVLNMNDPVTRWIPELAHRDGFHSGDELDITHWTDITVGDAAAHLSGLGGDTTTDISAFPFDWEALGLPKLSKGDKIPSCKGPPGAPVCTRKDFLNIFKSYRPPIYQPSQSPVYSNAGISLVGLVIEAASKKTFDAAIKDLVLKPLGLEKTYSGIVPENSENMFIPAGSPDWDADIGIFAPAGAMGSSTADMLSFMTNILKNKALSPSSTRRWLKPNTFTSTWSASVGSPWEIYRVDNLTSDGRIIDLYTKGGTLSGYQSGMAMIPDTGLVVSVLGAGPEVSSVWAQLATLNIIKALIPAIDMAARDEAKIRFAGMYFDKKTGSTLTLSLDKGPGLVLSNWTARGFDVLPNLNRFQPGRYNDTADSSIKSVRLYPTGIENKSRAAWRVVFPALSDTEAEMIEGLTKVKDVTCITWHMLDRFIYNGLSMDHFEFKYGKDGKALVKKQRRRPILRILRFCHAVSQRVQWGRAAYTSQDTHTSATMHQVTRLMIGLSSLLPALATPTGLTKDCVQLQIPVTASANNTRYNSVKVESTIDLVDFIWDTSTWSHANRSTEVLPVHGTYSISAQLCIPADGEKSDILQVATHGLGFDKRYWDPELRPEEYSYVDTAIARGYSILTYDRLGTGKSSKADGYNEVQLGLQVAILKELTVLARDGKLLASSKVLSKRPHKTFYDYKPRKVVHIGHSFGSATTSGLLSLHGSLSDGAILTGFLPNNQSGKVGPNAFGFEFARQHDPKRFGDRPAGYAVQASLGSIQQIFLKKGSFEVEALEYAEKIKQTGTVGELSSSLFGQRAAEFKGPLQYFIGENDYPLCDGDCNNTYDMETLKGLNPAASHIGVHLQPGTGHGLTLSTNATAGYEVMLAYLDSQGL
ncbi:hypothetical protein FGADI_9820 [Fusarium gaditjirri]|uniref:Beta-lactamase-related domain-containing protein n=1 Tax=Fusarium gaditjirri TaxID=282569 RepID=A0A8H4SZ01_9HYPO|nr:hypothetical protein FGADI_9820 [Fusarium gaditjirri]